MEWNDYSPLLYQSHQNNGKAIYKLKKETRAGWGLVYCPLWVLQNNILSNLMKRKRKLWKIEKAKL